MDLHRASHTQTGLSGSIGSTGAKLLSGWGTLWPGEPCKVTIHRQSGMRLLRPNSLWLRCRIQPERNLLVWTFHRTFDVQNVPLWESLGDTGLATESDSSKTAKSIHLGKNQCRKCKTLRASWNEAVAKKVTLPWNSTSGNNTVANSKGSFVRFLSTMTCSRYTLLHWDTRSSSKLRISLPLGISWFCTVFYWETSWTG